MAFIANELNGLMWVRKYAQGNMRCVTLKSDVLSTTISPCSFDFTLSKWFSTSYSIGKMYFDFDFILGIFYVRLSATFHISKEKKLKFDFSHSNLAMQFWCWKINYNSCMQKNCWMKWASADGDGDGVGGGGAVVSIAICCLLVVVLLLNIVVFFGVVYVVCQIRTQNFWMMKNEHRTTDVFRQIFSASRNQKTSVCYL